MVFSSKIQIEDQFGLLEWSFVESSYGLMSVPKMNYVEGIVCETVSECMELNFSSHKLPFLKFSIRIKRDRDGN